MGNVRLDDGIKGYIVRTARKDHWKVAGWYDLDDLIQDGYLVYCKCLRSYVDRGPTQADDQRSFMCYFGRAFGTHIVDLARKRSLTAESTLTALGVENSGHAEALMPPEPEHSTLAVLLAQAPEHLRRHVANILSSDAEFRSTRLRTVKAGNSERVIRGRTRQRETGEQWMERVTGQPGVAQLLRDYFLGIAAPEPA